jgi:hypothetical protein
MAIYQQLASQRFVSEHNSSTPLSGTGRVAKTGNLLLACWCQCQAKDCDAAIQPFASRYCFERVPWPSANAQWPPERVIAISIDSSKVDADTSKW